MQPPGSQGNHPNMSPRRHSAFSAPHQHGESNATACFYALFANSIKHTAVIIESATSYFTFLSVYYST